MSSGMNDALSLVWTLVGTAGGGLLLWIAVARARRQTAAEVAQAVAPPRPPAGWLALRDRLGAEGDGDRLTVVSDGLRISLERLEVDVGETTLTRIFLRVSGDLAPIGATIAGGGGVTTGDTTFDGMVRITGDPVLALTLLTGSLRRRLADAVSQGWKLEREGDGARLVRTYGIDYYEGLHEDLAEAKRLARELRPPANLADRYFDRLDTEPVRAARWRLAEVAPREWLDQASLRGRLAANTDPSVRMRVARIANAPELWASVSQPQLLAAAEGGDMLAFEVLGERGAADAIPELRRIGAAISEKGRAADAIARIQSRVRGGGGELALAHDQSGGLAVVREPEA